MRNIDEKIKTFPKVRALTIVHFRIYPLYETSIFFELHEVDFLVVLINYNYLQLFRIKKKNTKNDNNVPQFLTTLA